MRVTATDAKNRFGQMLDECQRQPVVIEKAGRRHGVLLSAESYDALVAQLGRTTHESGQRFYDRHKEWFDMQNDLVERYGIPGEEYRPW